jgi:NADP-dependent 3-hydroxy acid dehydrogenase YdfG
LSARREERLRALAGELGGTVHLAGDIADPSLPQRLIARALDAFGRCDVVFNNAGAFAAGPLEKLDVETVCRMVRVNVEAAYRMAFEAMRHFKSVGQGDLVNVSSVAGTKVARAGIGWYAGTKFALEALSESLRIEGAPLGIRVSSIEPGMTQTELFSEPITSIPRALDADDIARVVEFILRSPRHVSVSRLMVLPSCQPI